MITISSTQRLAQLTGNLSQTLSEISTLLTDAAAAPADTDPKEAEKAPARKKTAKPQTAPAAQTAPEVKTESPRGEDSSDASEDKKITMIELRDLLNSKSQDGLTAEVKALIVSYGVKKLSQIPEEKYPEVYAAAEKITKEA